MPLVQSSGRGKLVFHQPLGALARIIMAGGGILALSAPHELLIRPGVPLLQWSMLPFWIIGVGAGLIGAVLLLAAVLGLTRTVTFDASVRQLRVDGNGSFGIGWSERYTFADILEFSVVKEEQSEGSPRFALQAILAGVKGPLEIDTFQNEQDAITAEAKIQALMLSEETS